MYYGHLMTTPPNLPLEDRKFNQETLDKKRELDIKEREVVAKEREILAKEQDLKRSRWSNPLVIGLLVPRPRE
jgi:hypothetical protein